MAQNSISVFGTAEQQLEIVNQAIYAILVGGQSYKIGTRQLERADLAELKDMQLKLMANIASKNDNGLFSDTNVAVFDGR